MNPSFSSLPLLFCTVPLSPKTSPSSSAAYNNPAAEDGMDFREALFYIFLRTKHKSVPFPSNSDSSCGFPTIPSRINRGGIITAVGSLSTFRDMRWREAEAPFFPPLLEVKLLFPSSSSSSVSFSLSSSKTRNHDCSEQEEEEQAVMKKNEEGVQILEPYNHRPP